MAPKMKFTDKIYEDAGLPYRTTTQLCLADFIFADDRPTAKSTKVLSHENFLLVSITQKLHLVHAIALLHGPM